MSVYTVTRKADGVEVTRYSAASVIADMYPLDVYVHSELPDEPSVGYSGDWRITKFAFRSRFTQTEKVTIEIASLDNPSAGMEARSLAAALRSNQQDIMAAQFIDLALPDTRGGVQALETYGLIGAGRAAEILDTPPTESEAWHGD